MMLKKYVNLEGTIFSSTDLENYKVNKQRLPNKKCVFTSKQLKIRTILLHSKGLLNGDLSFLFLEKILHFTDIRSLTLFLPPSPLPILCLRRRRLQLRRISYINSKIHNFFLFSKIHLHIQDNIWLLQLNPERGHW